MTANPTAAVDWYAMDEWRALLRRLYWWSCQLDEVTRGERTEAEHRAEYTEAQDAAFVELWLATDVLLYDMRDLALNIGIVDELVDEGLL